MTQNKPGAISHMAAAALCSLAAVAAPATLPAYLLLASRPAAAAAGQSHTFAIPAQSLVTALARFTETSGVQFFFDAAIARNLQSPGVTGSLTAEAALQRLLDGTGLTYRFTNDTTVTLVEAPKSGAAAMLPTIAIEGRKADTTAALSELPDPYAGGQVARGGRLGMLGNRDFMDTPLSTTSFTATRIEDQQAVTMAEVVNSDPSVRVTGHAGGILDAFFIRGFPVNEGNVGEIAFDGVYGVAPSFRVLTEYAERIEVIKGATALLYGMAPNSAVGGGINIVPKRAADTDLNRVTFDYAQDTQFGNRVDVSRRYGENREFGIRFNGSYHAGDTQADNQSREAYVGALAADYRTERFRGSVDLINQVEDLNAPSRPLFLTTGLATPDAPDNRRNITQSWEWSEINDKAGLLKGELDLNDRLTLFANFGGGQTRVDRLFGAPSILNAAGDTSVTPARWAQETDRIVADTGLREVFTAVALLLVFGIALLMQLAGLSMALGAFLAGVLLAESEYRHELETDIEPFKGLLLGLFFTAVGMSVDFGLLLSQPVRVLAMVLGLIVAKAIVLLVIARFARLQWSQTWLFVFLLAQGGEFAFVLFGSAAGFGIMDAETVALLTVVVALSMATAPLLVVLNDRLIEPRFIQIDDRPHDVPEDEGNPVIVAGFGRFGQIVVRLLYANRIGVTVLDHDSEIIDTLRKFDFKVFYGDATRLDLLEAAGAAKAKVLVVAVDSQEASLQLVDLAQKHFPHLKVISRARDLPHAMELMNRKVPVIERETFRSALHLGEETLKALGQPAYAARQKALTFRQHNQALLEQLHAHWDEDMDKRVTLQRQARARLQQNLEADEKAQEAARGLGWD